MLMPVAGPARAATDPDTIARALSRSPVYVDPAFENAVSESQRRRLVRALRGAQPPVYVAFVPIIAGDEYDGDPADFLSVLHDRLNRDGVYVTIHEGLLRHRQYGVSAAEDRIVNAASYVIIGEGPRNEAPAAHVMRFLEAVDDPTVVARYRAALAARDGSGGSPAGESGGGDEDGGDEDGGAAWSALLLVVALLIIAAAAVLVRRRRRGDGARYAHEPLPVLPRRVFENARAAAEEDLREQARRAVVDFAAALDPVSPPDDAAAAAQYELAVDASSAASRTLDDARGTLDLVGVLVLVDRGYAALAAAQALAAGRQVTPVKPLCFFNPLHGRSRTETGWSDRLLVPVCAECARALQHGGAPDALHDGQQAYMEGDSVWARSGYGAFADDLVGRVSRGEREDGRG